MLDTLDISQPLDSREASGSEPDGPEVADRDGRDRRDAASLRSAASLRRWSPTRRPPRHPVRSVPHRLRQDPSLDAGKDPAGWTLVAIRAADDLGGVRNGMTYDKEYGTSAGFFEKPRRIQFMEGPNEPAVADHLELNPRYLDFQLQPLDIIFRRADGKLIHKYPDVGIEYDDNTVRFGEIKSDDSWFNAPAIRRPLDRIDAALVSQGLSPILRIKGVAFRTDDMLEAHARAMNARLTEFDFADVQAVKATIMAGGGCASHESLLAALCGRRAAAEGKLYAMLLRRIVAFDLSVPPTPSTIVTLPRPAQAFALRELLTRFARMAA